jgi:hypothetical protein
MFGHFLGSVFLHVFWLHYTVIAFQPLKSRVVVVLQIEERYASGSELRCCADALLGKAEFAR